MKKTETVLFTSFLIAVCLFFYVLLQTEKPDLSVPRPAVFYAADGSEAAIAGTPEKRLWVALDDVSPFMKEAVVAIEDKRFWLHHGIDPIRIAGAAAADIQAMAKVQGASTITQQYARNLFLTHDKTWARKGKEAWLALQLETHYSKETILEGYLNTVYFGHGAYGVEAAASFYFGKSASELTLSESALLAGIPKGPSLYSPLLSRANAEKRRRLVLESMNLTDEERNNALADVPAITGAFRHQSGDTAYFIDAASRELERLGFTDQSGLRVYTTLQPAHQKAASRAVTESIAAGAGIEAALVSIDPATHFVTALAGGRDYRRSPFNRAVQSKRQPGSLLKPFLYYAALENGASPVSKRVSEPTVFDGGYAPKNFNSRYAERGVTMAEALAVSDNMYAMKTHLALKPETLVNTLKQFGVASSLDAVPSLALGSSGMTVIETANAYATLAAGGRYADPVFVLKVETEGGEVLYEYDEKPKQRFDRNKTAILVRMMNGMFDRSVSDYTVPTGAAMAASLTRPYAGKSGSTPFDYWMAGFSPTLSTVVWTGYDDSRTITKTDDRNRAKSVWAHYMEAVHKEQPPEPFAYPAALIEAEIDLKTGTLCDGGHPLLFEVGTEPTKRCEQDNAPDTPSFPSVHWFR